MDKLSESDATQRVRGWAGRRRAGSAGPRRSASALPGATPSSASGSVGCGLGDVGASTARSPGLLPLDRIGGDRRLVGGPAGEDRRQQHGQEDEGQAGQSDPHPLHPPSHPPAQVPRIVIAPAALSNADVRRSLRRASSKPGRWETGCRKFRLDGICCAREGRRMHKTPSSSPPRPARPSSRSRPATSEPRDRATAYDPQAEALTNAAPVQLPPSITASRSLSLQRQQPVLCRFLHQQHGDLAPRQPRRGGDHRSTRPTAPRRSPPRAIRSAPTATTSASPRRARATSAATSDGRELRATEGRSGTSGPAFCFWAAG